MLDDPDFTPADLPKDLSMEFDPNSIPMPNGLPKGSCMVADIRGATALFHSRLHELREAERLDDRQKKLLEDLLRETRSFDDEEDAAVPEWATWMWSGLRRGLTDDALKGATKDEVLAETRHTYNGTFQLLAYCMLVPNVAIGLVEQGVDLISELAGEHAEKLRPLETAFVSDRVFQVEQLMDNEEVKEAWEFLRPRLTFNARRAIDHFIFELAFELMEVESNGEKGE
jgi:hypothetical protein